MKINLFVNNDLDLTNLEAFFLSLKNINFSFQKMNNLDFNTHQKNFLVCTKGLSKNNYEIISQQLQNHNLSQCCIFLPLNLNKYFESLEIKKIYYPINILNFERSLINLFDNEKFYFKNLELQHDNNLLHINNKKYIHLTEIESKIIKLLFKYKIVFKETINSQILNQSPDIESKSLDSHLYRLRKKLLFVDDQIQIIPFDNKSIKIA